MLGTIEPEGGGELLQVFRHKEDSMDHQAL